MIRKRTILLFIATLMAGHLAIAQDDKSVPVIFSHDAAILSINKSKIKVKDASLLPAYEQLLKDAEKALNFKPVSVMEKTTVPPSGDKHDYMSLAPYYWPDPSKPGGVPYIRKDGETNPEVKEYKDKEYLPKLCEAVNTLGLAFYFSNDNKYADHAGQLIRVWFLDKNTRMNPNLNYAQAMKGTNDGRGAGLIDTRHLIKLVDAIVFLHSSKSWTSDDQHGMIQWFNEFLNWMQTSKNGINEMNAKNNHGVWYDAQRLSFALFTGQNDVAKNIVLNVQTRLDKQMDENGNFPAELERTNSLHYSVFVVEPLFMIAQMAKPTGIDLLTYTSSSGKSLNKGFTTLLPYLTQEKKWTGKQIKDFDFEEAIPLLVRGTEKYNCTTCTAAINKIMAGETKKLRIRLFTTIDI
ncbi:MAG: alginate lyase family protein [Bacteroidota bacterium]|nr:alginate lyase family protein [Bacteroidota bacterium]